MYIYLGTEYIEIQFFGARSVEDYVPGPRWRICSPMTMSSIPWMHTFSGEDVPDPCRDIYPLTTMYLLILRHD